MYKEGRMRGGERECREGRWVTELTERAEIAFQTQMFGSLAEKAGRQAGSKAGQKGSDREGEEKGRLRLGWQKNRE